MRDATSSWLALVFCILAIIVLVENYKELSKIPEKLQQIEQVIK